MKTVRAVIVVEVEITLGDVASCVRDLAEKFDGYQPPGGDLDYQVTESRVQQAAVVE